MKAAIADFYLMKNTPTRAYSHFQACKTASFPSIKSITLRPANFLNHQGHPIQTRIVFLILTQGIIESADRLLIPSTVSFGAYYLVVFESFRYLLLVQANSTINSISETKYQNKYLEKTGQDQEGAEYDVMSNDQIFSLPPLTIIDPEEAISGSNSAKNVVRLTT
ncbi:hypothetical protein RF11_01751 [Thelohanellus kitauei]|uniref:Uncharacterized protein n=1 Tax=Thelohanellus kitauei TaxID=669202 RepID=A0A0C2M9N5_THEKT|nr:hypothetical protein RF11_01751 [Thelohanellus kitauei]